VRGTTTLSSDDGVRRRKMTLQILRPSGALRETSNVAGVAVVLRIMDR
jgi:hypothetical protein